MEGGLSQIRSHITSNFGQVMYKRLVSFSIQQERNETKLIVQRIVLDVLSAITTGITDYKLHINLVPCIHT